MYPKNKITIFAREFKYYLVMEKKKKVVKESVIKDTKLRVSTDGEILGIDQTISFPVGKEPPYYKQYLEDMGKVQGLNPAERVVWDCLCKNMSFKNKIVLVKAFKEIIAEETGKKYETIRAAIKSLSAKGLLIPMEGKRSVYIINPMFAAKGEWKDIRALRLVIEYSEQGRSIKVNKITNNQVVVEEYRQKELFYYDEEGNPQPNTD